MKRCFLISISSRHLFPSSPVFPVVLFPEIDSIGMFDAEVSDYRQVI